MKAGKIIFLNLVIITYLLTVAGFFFNQRLLFLIGAGCFTVCLIIFLVLAMKKNSGSSAGEEEEASAHSKAKMPWEEADEDEEEQEEANVTAVATATGAEAPEPKETVEKPAVAEVAHAEPEEVATEAASDATDVSTSPVAETAEETISSVTMVQETVAAEADITFGTEVASEYDEYDEFADVEDVIPEEASEEAAEESEEEPPVEVLHEEVPEAEPEEVVHHEPMDPSVDPYEAEADPEQLREEIATLRQLLANAKAEIATLREKEFNDKEWGTSILPAEMTPKEDLTTMDIVKAAKNVTEEFRYAAARAGIRIQVSSQDEQVMVRADENLIRVLFRNIVDNSIKYMNREGMLVITLSTIGDDLFVVLKDNGEGLASNETNHIFELNYQGSNRISGNGLGLAQAKAVVEYYGGNIYAKSTLGGGMGIYIQLPTC